ncbi:MAG TPA: 4Fe-4S dicluster domain-containing protein [Clostridia bacterium]|nr:4Fe-4S dicluster domain-containing protein [Clostridia bacterium]
MSQICFFVNMDTCIGCGACQVACKDGRGQPTDVFFRRVGLVKNPGSGREFPFSGACGHCAFPRCTEACPTGAMHKLEDGTVEHDDGVCIGCGACLWNCPNGAISFSKRLGVTQKCDGCYERRSRGLNPLCVDACPTKSIRFGERDELIAAYGEGDPLTEVLENADLTRPSLIIRLPSGWKKGSAK